jgi:hypothetical protein
MHVEMHKIPEDPQERANVAGTLEQASYNELYAASEISVKFEIPRATARPGGAATRRTKI